MTKLWIKVMPAAICLLLVFLLIPNVGKVYADSGYSVYFIRPENGEVITTTKFTAEVAYTYDDDPGRILKIGVGISDDIVPDSVANIPPQEFELIVNMQDVGPGSGQLTFSIDLSGLSIPPGKRILGVLVDYPGMMISVDYMIIIDYQPGNPAPEPTSVPSIYFEPSKYKQKAGEPVTLKWIVTGADSITIDHSVGNVDANGNKDVTPTEATRSAVQLMGGDGTVTEVVTYTAEYTMKATNQYGETTQLVTIEIEPKTIDEIFKDYEAWGTSTDTYTWPDDTKDSQPLVGPSWAGGANNFWETFTSATNIGSYEGLRWDCNAMQYRSLVCLNELKQRGKLIGWDYMPIEGATIAHTGVYSEHQAVAIWQTGNNWERTATVLDPHDRQQPHRYSVTDGLESIAPWHPDEDYSETYPGIPNGEAIKTGEYQMDEFTKNTWDRWGNGQGAKTPWQYPVTFQDKFQAKAKEMIEVPLLNVFKMAGVFCPANVLITNAAGQRLGRLADGTLVAEFEPLYADYWSNETGDKQWVYALLDGAYTIEITGSSNGNFRLLTYTGGDKINDYGENPLSTSQPAILTMQSGAIGTLTLADGTKVTPAAKTIDELFPPKASAPGTGEEGLNWGIIAGVAAGVIIMMILLRRFARKKVSPTN